MHKSTPHIPTCIALDEVVNPQDLWDLVMEGETFPEDESSQKAEEKGGEPGAQAQIPGTEAPQNLQFPPLR